MGQMVRRLRRTASRRLRPETVLGNSRSFAGWTDTVQTDPTTGNREPATVVVLKTSKTGTSRSTRDG
jgi:hypothetical protein